MSASVANDQTVPASSMARVVLPCTDLTATIDFFCDRLNFHLDNIWPADKPSKAIVSTPGLHVELRVEASAGDPSAAGTLTVVCDQAYHQGIRSMTAPNGTLVEIIASTPELLIPELKPSFVIRRLDPDSSWITGRAGMRYRDLIPDRLGGRFIASHIQIPEGGPVPDYVHFHDVRFQMIFCASGWVRVVYEDQGEPFVLHAGDCVLQPPLIRHQVLEASDGLEVVEIGCPAEHLTTRDHLLELPTGVMRPERDFSGQRFVRHIAAEAPYGPWRSSGFVCRDTGISAATDGLANVRVARPMGESLIGPPDWIEHGGELLQLFVLGGHATVDVAGRGAFALGRGTSVVIPAGERFSIERASDDFELLDVAL